MSETSISFKDQGYTSPDFLTNLFKKPLYSSFSSMNTIETSTPLLRNLSNRSNGQQKENQYGPFISEKVTSPLAFRNIKENKFYRSDQGLNEQKISSKKYKIFFKTLMFGKMNEEQMNSMWQRLQKSLSNPFDFDSLIEEVKSKRQKQIQEEIISKVEIYHEKKAKVLSKSQNHGQIKRDLFKSLKKKEISTINNIQHKTICRKAIKKEVIEMRSIILLGQKFIRKR